MKLKKIRFTQILDFTTIVISEVEKIVEKAEQSKEISNIETARNE